MRMKALGANLPSVSSRRCAGSLRRADRKMEREQRSRPPGRRVSSAAARDASGSSRRSSWSRSYDWRPAAALLDGGADAHVGAAAADVAGHRGVDVGIVGIGRGCEQRRRRHDLARLAIAALDHFEVEPGLLHLGAGRRCADAFDGGDRASPTAPTGSRQERTGLPSICTVQAPHCAMPQPNFVPVMPSMSRSTHSSGMSAGASNVLGSR